MQRITLTSKWIDVLSPMFLILGLVLTFFRFSEGIWYFLVNALLYLFSFGVLYASRKFRQFIIHPASLRPTRTTYKIYPWIPEGEVRWPARLKEITVITSNSFELKELALNLTKFVEDGNPTNGSVKINKHHSTTTYSVLFDPPEEIEINAHISFTIEQNDEVESDSRPFLEYVIEYEPPIPLLAFKYRRRIF